MEGCPGRGKETLSRTQDETGLGDGCHSGTSPGALMVVPAPTTSGRVVKKQHKTKKLIQSTHWQNYLPILFL